MFRPEIVTVIDIATRKVIGWSAGLACWRALAQPIAPPSPIMPRPEARSSVCKATLWKREAKHLAYTTGRGELKQTGRSKLYLEWPEFFDWCGKAVARYNARPHFGLERRRDEGGRLIHESPNDAWVRHMAAGWQPITAAQDELDDLFFPTVTRKVQRATVSLSLLLRSARSRRHARRIMAALGQVHRPYLARALKAPLGNFKQQGNGDWPTKITAFDFEQKINGEVIVKFNALANIYAQDWRCVACS